jgi:hypothetical protein
VVGAPRRSEASSIDGKSSRINEAAWIISIAQAGSIAFAMSPPNWSTVRRVMIGRKRFPGETSA